MSTDTQTERLAWITSVCLPPEDTFRPHLHAPFRAGPWTAGTDGLRAVAWPTLEGDPEGEVHDTVRAQMARMLEPPEGARRWEATVEALREWAAPEPEAGPKPCEPCGGTGTVPCYWCEGAGRAACECPDCGDEHVGTCADCDGEKTVECDPCDGSGTAREPLRQGWLVDRPVSLGLLHDTLRLAPAGPVTLFVPPEVEHPVHIHGEAGWRVLFMGRRPECEGVEDARANPFPGAVP